MKVRDSGMPDEMIWNKFFDIDLILSELQIDDKIKDLVEIGSGYGTFTIPASKKIKGKLYAYDIENEMIEKLKNKIENQKIENIVITHLDIPMIPTQ
jgi:16S rRNA A1518/A1519 N6-dimethyltransferase RsmA/KsgA/DIM1 with predicted DNA glycosylase/AP lyase activity